MRVVVQAYGRQDIVDQAVFSVLSLLRWEPDFEIWIYTDKEQSLREFFAGQDQVQIKSITSEQIKTWRGSIDFVHRVKLEIIKLASKDSTQSVLYIDGDTIFVKDPQPLKGRVSTNRHVMHIQESRLAEAKDLLTKKIARFCKKQKFHLSSGVLQIPESTAMWNAGVIGLHPLNFSLLDQMLELTDVAYTLYQKHVIEQLAVSFYLQSTGNVVASDDIIYHYWQTKETWQKRIDDFLKSVSTASEALERLDQVDWSQPEPPRKKTWWEKIFKTARV